MEEQIVKNITERPCSYEFGKAGNRFKIYFSETEDLVKRLKSLVEAGLAVEEDFNKKIYELDKLKEIQK